MELNAFVFPAPESCYLYRKIENIFWLPKEIRVKPQTKLSIGKFTFSLPIKFSTQAEEKKEEEPQTSKSIISLC